MEAADFRPIPPGTPRMKPDASWWAGPFFVAGIFLLTGVAAGIRMQPSLRILAGLAGLGLAWACASRISRPLPTAFLWGGLFLAWTLRAGGAVPVALGLAAALAGGLAYARRRRPS